MSPEGPTGEGGTNAGKASSGHERSGHESSGHESSGHEGSGKNSPEASGVVGRAAFDAQLAGVSGPLESLPFEELVGALERVAARLAGGDLGIESAADLYEQAELLYGAAQERLAAVEARIERLSHPDQV
jgi:exodeoxyribonuclease VII small subunit